VCPVESLCAARESGDPERFPAPAKRAAVRRVTAIAGLVTRAGRVLLVRRPSRGLLGGLWELPNVEGADPAALAESLRERTGLRTRASGSLGRLRHQFTHRDLRLEVVALEVTGGRVARKVRAEARFCTAADLGRLPLSKLTKKALALRRPM
jgi:A/G-specific adenine glycosylase